MAKINVTANQEKPLFTASEFSKQIEDKLNRYFAITIEEATKLQIYKAVAMTVRDLLIKLKNDFNTNVKKEKAKRVYYLSMEFLLGRSLKNNINNLGIENAVTESLKKHKIDINELYGMEDDAGLGNGGLGRLAACYMDALSSQEYPALGFTLKYEYGLFKQKIVDNVQVELPDVWLDTGEAWLVPRSDKTFKVRLGGYVNEVWNNDGTVSIQYSGSDILEAVPYDMMISGGSGSKAVNVLRLWTARSGYDFNMHAFSQGDYMNAMKKDSEAELISKVLYPADDHYNGKTLRLNQQYFLVSASLQNILKDHLKNYKDLYNLPDKVAIHINDTHPALCVPELMRLLIDEHNFNWEDAWNVVINTIAYTNHTVLAEALEKWGEDMISSRLPRIYAILKEIDRRFIMQAKEYYSNDWDKIERMLIISKGVIKMANLSVIGSHHINGVSALHSDIIKNTIFKDYNDLYPQRFTNVTNGIAHRRWLCYSNPKLSNFIETMIGSGFIKDASQLKKFEQFAKTETVLDRLGEIKMHNKIQFSDYMKKNYDFKVNPESRFDVQIKRLHEYKRQLMNILKILTIYLDLKNNPSKTITPQTFIFGAKAAPGYYHAKRIISLVNRLSEQIQSEPRIKSMLDVLFMENYNVTKAEILIPAAEVSEQISLAGKEASGTSNMKFMINGAVTIGTLDGANVEIYESVGSDNMFLFGMTAPEVEQAWSKGYYASAYLNNPQIKEVVDFLKNSFADGAYSDIAGYLTTNSVISDPYMCLADYQSYMDAHYAMDARYQNKSEWNRMSLVNISEAGRFAADRSIKEYAQNIWKLKRVYD